MLLSLRYETAKPLQWLFSDPALSLYKCLKKMNFHPNFTGRNLNIKGRKVNCSRQVNKARMYMLLATRPNGGALKPLVSKGQKYQPLPIGELRFICCLLLGLGQVELHPSEGLETKLHPHEVFWHPGHDFATHGHVSYPLQSRPFPEIFHYLCFFGVCAVIYHPYDGQPLIHIRANRRLFLVLYHVY
jgi:hypothetical protein